MDNYQVSRDRAQEYFLTFDQDKIIRRWKLNHDADFLYLSFLGKPYRVCRKSGSIFRCREESQADFSEVLSIFDLLCHDGDCKVISGQFAPVNSLKGRPRAVGVGTDFHSETASRFDRNPEAFRHACETLGGTPVNMGDIGYRFPVFGELSVILKFYHADEDFPASMTLLWDSNTLDFIFYETVFYIAGFLLQSIEKTMKKQH